MTLGNAAAAHVRLIVWCRARGHQVEPDPAEHARRYGAAMTEPDWQKRLVCFGLRQPRNRHGGHWNRATASRTTMRRLRNLIASMGLALVSCSAIADDDGRWLPDKALTPGAIAETRAAVLCVHGYAKAHRAWRDKVGTLAKYGIAADRASLFEDDDLIPVCLGGNNASPLNHWPQSLSGAWGAGAKDALEQRVCSEICFTRDDAQLARYQAAFAKNWVALYRQIMR